MDDIEVLTLPEAAAYLKVSERTIYDWAQKGKIPAGKLGSSWRFIKKDLEEWVRKSIEEPVISKRKNSNISKLLQQDEIFFTDFSTKQEVLDFLITKMSSHETVCNESELKKAIYEREELMSTGIGLGVAVPHVRINSIKDINIIALRNSKPINDYDSLDSEPIKLIFMIVANSNQHAQYIKTLSSLSKRIKNDTVRDNLLNAKTEEDFFTIIVES